MCNCLYLKYYTCYFAWPTVFCPLETQSRCDLFLFFSLNMFKYSYSREFLLVMPPEMGQQYLETISDKSCRFLSIWDTKKGVPGIILIIPVHWLLSLIAVMPSISESALLGLWISGCSWNRSAHKLGTPKINRSTHCPRGWLFRTAKHTWLCRPPN